MKTFPRLLIAACFLSFSAAAQTCIPIATGEFHLVPGYALITNLPTGTMVLAPYGTYMPSWITYVRSLFPPGWSPASPPWRPDHGYIIRTSATTLCLPAVLPPPVLPLHLPAGYSLVCSQSNGPAAFEAIVGRAPDPGTRVYRLTPGPEHNPLNFDPTNYTIYTFTNDTWTPEAPVAALGEAIWVYQPPMISNPKLVAEGFSFDASTALLAPTTIEYADSIENPDPIWQTLTNLSGSGQTTNVVDTVDMNVVPQRFYRLKLMEGL